jgi:hypothetical protein
MINRFLESGNQFVLFASVKRRRALVVTNSIEEEPAGTHRGR